MLRKCLQSYCLLLFLLLLFSALNTNTNWNTIDIYIVYSIFLYNCYLTANCLTVYLPTEHAALPESKNY